MHLIFPCAYCKIVLRLGDLLQTRVAIHGDQIASQTGQRVVAHLSFGSRTSFDHFVASYKMVKRGYPWLRKRSLLARLLLQIRATFYTPAAASVCSPPSIRLCRVEMLDRLKIRSGRDISSFPLRLFPPATQVIYQHWLMRCLTISFV